MYGLVICLPSLFAYQSSGSWFIIYTYVYGFCLLVLTLFNMAHIGFAFPSAKTTLKPNAAITTKPCCFTTSTYAVLLPGSDRLHRALLEGIYIPPWALKTSRWIYFILFYIFLSNQLYFNLCEYGSVFFILRYPDQVRIKNILSYW